MSNQIHIDVNGYLRNLLLGKTVKQETEDKFITVAQVELRLIPSPVDKNCWDMYVEVMDKSGRVTLLNTDDILDVVG